MLQVHDGRRSVFGEGKDTWEMPHSSVNFRYDAHGDEAVIWGQEEDWELLPLLP
jgi:hypothetical protein